MQNYELKLDYDIKDWKTVSETLFNRYATLYNILKIQFLNCLVNETKNGFHVRLNVKTSNLGGNKEYDTAFMQLLLDSDYKREAFNLRRVSNSIDNWNVLFSHKYKNNELVGQELPAIKETKQLTLKLIGFHVENELQTQ